MAKIKPKFLLDVEIIPSKYEEGIHHLVNVLKPQWIKDKVRIKTLGGGLINQMYHVYMEGEDAREGLVVRICSTTAAIFNRDMEFIGLQAAYEAGCGTAVHAVLKNGLVVGFFPGRTLTYDDYVNPHISKLIAALFAKLHHIDVASGNFLKTSGDVAQVDISMDAIRQLVTGTIMSTPETLPDPVQNKRMKDNLKPKEDLLKELAFLLDFLNSLGLKLVFSHNDTHCRNIMYDEHKDEVNLVDFEVCFCNFRFRDLGYFFAMLPYLAILGIVTKEESEKPVDENMIRGYLRSYLETKFSLEGKSDDVTDDDITELKYQMDIGTLMLDFLWMSMGVIVSLNAVDFDGLGIAILAKERYYSNKDKIIEMAKEFLIFKEKRQK